METLARDLRHAFRVLRRDLGVTLVALLSIALAIGANATIFTWLDGLVLHPLPAVPSVDRIVQLHTLGPQGAVWSVSYPDLQDWRLRHTHSPASPATTSSRRACARRDRPSAPSA